MPILIFFGTIELVGRPTIACVHGIREGPSNSILVKTGPKAHLDSFDLAVVGGAIHTMYTHGMSVSVLALQKWLSFHHSDIIVSEATLLSGVLRLGVLIPKGNAFQKIQSQREASVVCTQIK